MVVLERSFAIRRLLVSRPCTYGTSRDRPHHVVSEASHLLFRRRVGTGRRDAHRTGGACRRHPSSRRRSHGGCASEGSRRGQRVDRRREKGGEESARHPASRRAPQPWSPLRRRCYACRLGIWSLPLTAHQAGRTPSLLSRIPQLLPAQDFSQPLPLLPRARGPTPAVERQVSARAAVFFAEEHVGPDERLSPDGNTKGRRWMEGRSHQGAAGDGSPGRAVRVQEASLGLVSLSVVRPNAGRLGRLRCPAIAHYYSRSYLSAHRGSSRARMQSHGVT